MRSLVGSKFFMDVKGLLARHYYINTVSDSFLLYFVMQAWREATPQLLGRRGANDHPVPNSTEPQLHVQV